MKFYLYNKSRNVKATLEVVNNEYILKKGSTISEFISDKFRAAASVEKRRKGIVKDNILLKDIVFKSSSVAGEFVLGTSCNGKEKWKDGNGKKLGEVIK